jgi:four helix bundle protein
MSNPQYNLEQRTIDFSKSIFRFLKTIKVTIYNRNIIDQLLRSSTSIGANYREANDALGKKDFLQRLRIARKEAKETAYWLEILVETEPDQKTNIVQLLGEVVQLKKILSTIITKSNQ